MSAVMVPLWRVRVRVGFVPHRYTLEQLRTAAEHLDHEVTVGDSHVEVTAMVRAETSERAANYCLRTVRSAVAAVDKVRLVSVEPVEEPVPEEG